MFRKFLNKLKNKNTKKSSIQTDSVCETARHIDTVSSSIPYESPSTLLLHSNDSYSASPSLNFIPSQSLTNSSAATPEPIYIRQSFPTVQLSVSNSHGFHIGDVHNVTVSNGSTANFNSNESGLAALGKPLKNLKATGLTEPKGTDSLEYIYDKIKDWEISLISENVEDDSSWKSIGIALGMEEDELMDCLTTSDDGDEHHLIVLNILRDYICKFPDTSLGYIVSILRETKQLKAIDKIRKLRL